MPSVMLTISRTEAGDYLVVVSGEGFYNAPPAARVGVRIKGDDEWFDETLFSLKPGFNHYVYRGTFTLSDYAPGSKLNEDWGRDEVYAIASVDGYGDVRSNVIKAYY